MKIEFHLFYLIHHFKRTNFSRKGKKSVVLCAGLQFTEKKPGSSNYNIYDCRLSAVRLEPPILQKVHTLLIRVWKSFSTEA